MKELEKKAIKVLNNNWKEDGGFSIPCANLYPFQWKWDSGFIAIGFAYFDMAKAEKEIETLIRCSMGKWVYSSHYFSFRKRQLFSWS